MKRPALRKNDRVTLASHKSVIPAYDGKPWVLRDTVLTVSHISGTGSKRNPWSVAVTDGTHFWTLEPDDVVRVNGGTSHSTIKRRHGMRTSMRAPFSPGDVVVSDYRVPPFYKDETLVVDEVKNLGTRGSPYWRVRVHSGRGAQGWLDGSSLVRM